jgi:2-iminobutanoate/2-iminopropanoate deaminase
MKTIITAPDAPKAVGPYSVAVRTGNLLFMSGQIPLDPATGQLVANDIETQTERVLQNITAVLAAAGATLANVVKSSVFMADLSMFQRMNAVYARYFNSEPPARSTYQVAALPLGALVEIECIAVLPDVQ